MTPLRRETVADLWAHARALGEVARTELSPAHARRALVTLAVAGTGGDAGAFRAEAAALHEVIRSMGLDAEPLFDAAAALVAEDDLPAREALVRVPRDAAGLTTRALEARLGADLRRG